MHSIQMVQEQHAIYFGYAFLGVLGQFYSNRKGLITNQIKKGVNNVIAMVLCINLLPCLFYVWGCYNLLFYILSFLSVFCFVSV